MYRRSNNLTSLLAKLDHFLLENEATECQDLGALIEVLESERKAYYKVDLSVGVALSVVMQVIDKVKRETLILTVEARILMLVLRDMLEEAISILSSVKVLSVIQIEKLDEASARLVKIAKTEMIKQHGTESIALHGAIEAGGTKFNCAVDTGNREIVVKILLRAYGNAFTA